MRACRSARDGAVASSSGSGGGSIRAWHRSQQWLLVGTVSVARMEPHRQGDAGTYSEVYSYYLFGLDSFAYREEAGSGVSATGTGSRRCSEQEPELPAASRAFSLPIFFSSGYGRSVQGARATTARYGRDSAAAGQGARARCGQRADRAAAGQTSGKTRSRGAALLGEINGAGVRVLPWSQSATCSACDLPQAQRTQFWLVA